MALPYTPPAIVTEAVKKYDQAKSIHDTFVRRYERAERSYRGVLRAQSDAAKWKHQQHPPYAFNLIETIVSNTVEQGLSFNVRPAPFVNMSIDEANDLLAKTDAINDLLRHEHRVDEMDQKQRPLFLSQAICGVGIGKSYWNYTEGSTKRQGVQNVDIHGPNGDVIGTVPTVIEIEEHGIIRDHSTFEVVDPRDFILHESARALQPMEPGGAQYLFHRTWYSYEQLKSMEASGFVKNVDMLKESLDFSGEYADRETELWNINRTKDLIEVIEYWCFKSGKVWRTLIGNRVVLLRDEEANPFWHGGYPFVISSSMPQLFTWRGMSDVELIEQLQEIIWELTNQTLDNVELINNAIMLIRSDVDDPDAFEFYPGARWPVDSTDQVAPLIPPYQIANVASEQIALMKGDLQNVTSATLFAGGAQTATVDQKTATGASIVMNAAQQRLTAKKYQSQFALKQEAQMRIKNCQQFITDQRLIHIVGPDGVPAFRDLGPMQIQGEFIAELDPMTDSQMRQEKRAESAQFFQYATQFMQFAAATGNPMNAKELFGWFAKKWDIIDWERFFSNQPAAMGAAGMGTPGGGGGMSPAGGGASGNAPQLQQPNMGTTAATAVDASSPSATGGLGMSGQQFLQRALTLARGGGGA